jgi:hypothetical protein
MSTLLETMLASMLARYGDPLEVPLPYTTRAQAEQAHAQVSEACPGLVVDVEIDRGEWRLVVSHKSTGRRVAYDA